MHFASTTRRETQTKHKTKMHTKAICAVAFLALNAAFAVGGLEGDMHMATPEKRRNLSKPMYRRRSMLYGTKE